MKRIKIEFIYLIVLALITTILFFTVTMDKTEYHGLDTNPVYESIVFLIIGSVLIFNHMVLNYKMVANIVISFLIIIIALTLSDFATIIIISQLERNDNYVTPLGWQFKYKWYQLLLLGFFALILNEALYGLMKRVKILFKN